MESLTVLNNLKIAAPCKAPWDQMRGDDRVRFCDSCSKNVYNLSHLTANEAVALIEKAEGHLCMRLYRRGDGTVLTGDCPVGLRAALRRRLIRLATAGVIMGATLQSMVWLYTGCGDICREIPPPPSGPGVTLSDWAEWAVTAMGFRKSAGGPRITGGDVY
jgi:hypothetical protein